MKVYKVSGRLERVLAEGRAVGAEIATGKARIIPGVNHLSEFQQGEVLVADATTPDWEPVMQTAAAIVTNRGGRTCHAAIITRELGMHLGVNPQHVHAYVVGEHGDSEVLTWSSATIGGSTLEEFGRQREVELNAAARQRIDHHVRRAAYEIIEGKGATYYGIACALARIAQAIINDQRAILTVSTQSPETAGLGDVTLSLPHLLGGEEIRTALPLALSEDERISLHNSAAVIRAAIESLSL